jgi:4-nitrophenyl phosphatase
MKTVEDYLHKFRGFGVELEARQIVTSGEATADALATALPGRGAVFVVGERGIVHALTGRGFNVVTDPKDERPVAAVVVGLDREFTYAQLHTAAAMIRQGSLFYGTNPDRTFPMPDGLVPGAGALLAAIEAASGRQPVVVGKPSPLLFEIAAGRMDIPAASILVVGDRLETDIAGGQAFGARTALVLTGVGTLEQAGDWSPPPTIVTPSLSALLGV